jgi:GrpB-like predicted nucleotidyltransferase (UPF0157 family)
MSDETSLAQGAMSTEEKLRATTIGKLEPLVGKVLIVAYNPDWPKQFAREARTIQAALGETMLRLEHVGSATVPGLTAKPIIDIVLVVADSADEPAYVPALEQAGYVLRNREPGWYEHRMLRRLDPMVPLHVFSANCEETEWMLRMRNWLRANVDDRDLYARTKRDLAERDWKYMQNHADAKSEVVEQILARARGGSNWSTPTLSSPPSSTIRRPEQVHRTTLLVTRAVRV